MEVGDAWRGDGFEETEVHVLGERLEERSAAAEEDRNLMQDHLVDESSGQSRCRDPPPMRATSLSPAAARAAATRR